MTPKKPAENQNSRLLSAPRAPAYGALPKYELEALLRLNRERTRVAKAKVIARRAELRAEFEQQLATEYERDDAAWKDAVAVAKQQVAEANRVIDAACEARGIPKKFRGGLYLGWFERGENGAKERRSELRRVAESRFDALETRANVTIDTAAVEFQTQLVAGTLTSDEARRLLGAMPSVEALMPALDLQTFGIAGGVTRPALVPGSTAEAAGAAAAPDTGGAASEDDVADDPYDAEALR
jgi:hypothetical protein